MKINETICGFTVKRIRPLDELNAEFIEMEHIKTGLEIVWIKRDEENKTFGIAFKTLPFDDTGVFHILEHSVLCGSEKYPVKEPFVDLLQTSMNTFLNAMTFPDKTLYPISSRNDKDFFNLMSVYLDAVFCPAIYNKAEIFYQEGWHYEPDENGNFSYKGVVFNEMKGVFAGADELCEMAIDKALFPDTPYKYVSGGDPASIPDLTYESFIESHRRFYSPSNAYVYFDGNVNIEKALDFLNSEYLSKYERGERISTSLVQDAVDAGITEIEYELGEDESKENKMRIAYAGVIGSFEDRERLVAMQVLSDVLCGGNQSLLTKCILSQGLAEDVSMQVCDGICQPWVKLEAQNIADGMETELETVIFDKLREFSDNGIDHSQLEASMANLEFRMRERDYGDMPQGIVLGFVMLETWLYGGDPISNLSVGDLFEKLRNKMRNGYFEQLIKEVLLNNNHKAKIVMKPSYTVGQERRARELERISKEVANFSDDDRAELIRKQEKLLEWQSSEDSPEAVATVPKLQLSDISAKPDEPPIEILDSNGTKALFHAVNCTGIAYFSLYFDAEDLSEEEISQLSFLTDILGKMRTQKYDEEALDRLSRLLFGDINYSVASFPSKNEIDKCRVKMHVSFSTLEKNIEEALAFVVEILTNTSFDNKKTALDLLKQLKTKYFQQFVMSGSAVGSGRIKAQYSACGVVNECAGGLKYYRWLCEQENDMNWKQLSGMLETLAEKVICSSRLTLSLTGADKTALANSTEYLHKSLNSGSKPDGEIKIKPWGKTREGIVIPSDVCFACAGGVLNHFDKYNGALAVASRVVSLAYLWNAVRVQGGAYGCGCRVDRNGFAFSYSYRDPSAVNSLEAYKKIPDFLEEISASDMDLTGFIIGTVAGVSPLCTPKMKGYRSDQAYFSDISPEDKEREIEEMLSVTQKTLLEISKLMKNVFEEEGICALGNREQLDECALDRIQTLQS